MGKSSVVKLILCVSFLAAPVLGAAAESITGPVVTVFDGDTLEIKSGEESAYVRLDGVDCPELRQPHGTRALQFVSRMVKGKEVTVEVTGEGDDGLLHGQVLLSSGKRLSEVLVESGLAWCSQDNGSGNRLSVLEQRAREGKKGLWWSSRAIPPWEYREQNPCHSAPWQSRSSLRREARSSSSSADDLRLEKDIDAAGSLTCDPNPLMKGRYGARKTAPRDYWVRPKNSIIVPGAALYSQGGYGGGGGYGGYNRSYGRAGGSGTRSYGGGGGTPRAVRAPSWGGGGQAAPAPRASRGGGGASNVGGGRPQPRRSGG